MGVGRWMAILRRSGGNMPVYNEKIGFIGAGNMAEAILGAIISAELAPAGNILISDIDPERAKLIKSTYHVVDVPSNKEIVETCDTVFFAVKPQQIDAVLTALAAENAFQPDGRKRRFVSIAAGIPIAAYENIIYDQLSDVEKPRLPIIRVMPNTPALVRSGTSAICANDYARPEDLEAIKKILSAMGKFFECKESDINAFTAVAGSGPAYGFYLIEAMTNAGVELGLARKDCLEMTVSTLRGALNLMESQNTDPATLRRNVTSPGGTTEAALSVMDGQQVKSAIIKAILAAKQRADELSK